MSNSKYNIDMSNGPLLKKIIIFSLPLMLSGCLQLFFNAADMIVAGQYAGRNALGAVGSTSSLINLIVNVFMGISTGVNVIIALCIGAKDKKNASEVAHTAVASSIIFGVLVGVIGFASAKPALTLMKCPPEVIGGAVTYMRIYFIGAPALLFYNFGSAILRAAGDTKRPLYYLSLAGVINIIVNLIFVINFHMGVAGVAWATVISETISAILVLRCLMKSDDIYKIELKKIMIHTDKFKRIIKVGLPAGIQSALFSISNVLIQSSVNSLGAAAVAGSAASGNLEGFVYTAMNSFHHTAMAFTGQNAGAKKFDRVRKILLLCSGLVIVIGVVLAGLFLLFKNPLLKLYIPDDPEAIKYGITRLTVIFATYYLCGLNEVIVGVLRGIGASLMPTLNSVFAICILRIIWVTTVFSAYGTMTALFVSYPVSWTVAIIMQLACYFLAMRKIKRTNALVNW
ncbi:MAG: MATE family efflux transporter [Eubacteriales bacterium]|nr:MATE family efflux transporter [Eubacteriales bacterium]